MSRVINYSLFLKDSEADYSDNIYLKGILKNIELAQVLFPGWQIHINIDESIPNDILKKLRQSSNVYLIHHNGVLGYKMLGKRFICSSPQNTQIMMCRDADNLLTQVDSTNINQWINFQKQSIFGYSLNSSKYMYLAGAIGFRQNMLNILKEEVAIREREGNVMTYDWDEHFLESAFRHEEVYQIDINSFQQVMPRIKMDKKQFQL